MVSTRSQKKISKIFISTDGVELTNLSDDSNSSDIINDKKNKRNHTLVNNTNVQINPKKPCLQNEFKNENELNKSTEKEIYQNFINIINDVDNDKEILNCSNEWQQDLSKVEIKKYEPEYILISKKISIIPKIQDILTVKMPFKIKCNLLEKIIILNNIQIDTFEHLGLKNSILEEIENYKLFNMDNVDYSNYKEIEKKLNDNKDYNIPLNYRILSSEMSFKNKTAVYNKFKFYNTLNESSNESSKLLNWIETILNLPTKTIPLNILVNSKNNTISKFLYDVNYILNAEIYGMKNVKEQILCILNNKITNPKAIGSSIGLVGPQGVGKTQIIKVLSKAIKLPFSSISLSGMTDSDHLLGHGFTYEGSRCGAIVDSLSNMKFLNGILFFDEIDKISKTPAGDGISKALLHITDFTQNNEFCDKYLGNNIKIDLSNIWFIYSLNYKELIDKTLLDRISLIEVSGYTTTEKKEMSIKYLIPNALKNIGLDKAMTTVTNCISFSDDALNLIIKKTNELYDTDTKDKSGNSGVRKLKDCIADTISKINYLNNLIQDDGSYGELIPSFAIKNFKLPYVINTKDINTLNIFAKDVETTHYGMYN
jgi:ATP-dependent Lon protease